jgi:putrescine importer
MAVVTAGPGVVPAGVSTSAPTLKRMLSTRDLVAYGIMMMFPLAPVAVYAAVTQATNGHMALAYLVALVAMAFTALSYGAMAGAFPKAGSTYTFTRKGLNQYLGLISGWSITLDYVLFPTVNSIIFGVFGNQLIPQIDYWVWVIGFLAFITLVNLREVKWLAQVSAVLLTISILVIAWFVVAAIGALSGGVGEGTIVSAKPFYNPGTFELGALLVGTSIACFSFLGFDAVSTLAEETHNPTRSVSRAMLVALLVITGLFIVQAYFGQLLVPDYSTLDPETAYFTVFQAAGGDLLGNVLSVAVMGACMANGVDSMGGAARLLYGMGRDSVIPRRIFGYLWPASQTPLFNVLIIAGLTFVLASQNLTTIIEMINFGALIAFFLVNISVISHFFVRSEKRDLASGLRYLVGPAFGAVVIAWLWWNLPSVSWAVSGGLPADLALLLPGAWLLLGIGFTLVTSNFLRKPLPELQI